MVVIATEQLLKTGRNTFDSLVETVRSVRKLDYATNYGTIVYWCAIV